MHSSTKKYLDLLRSAGYHTSTCHFCGAQTASVSDEVFCTCCESRVNLGIASPYPDISASLSKLSGDALNGNTKGLDAFLESRKQGELPPQIMYGIGNLYMHASSYRYSMRNYSGQGFMEDNSVGIYESLALTSKSRESFFKALDALDKDATGGSGALYLRFMINMRLKRFFYAGKILENVDPIDENNAIWRYSKMIYAVITRSKNADAQVASALNTGEPNTFYYLSVHLMHKKRFEDAEALLSELFYKTGMPSAKYLLGNIKELQGRTGT